MTTSSPTLASILRESALLWTRSFTLVYVYFLFVLVASFLMQGAYESSEAPDIRLYALFALVALIFCAFKAALFHMTGNVCRRYLKPDISREQWGQKPEVFKAINFSVFKDFLPGVGHYFLPVVLGLGIQAACLGGLLLLLQPLWRKTVLIAEPMVQSLIQQNGNTLTSQQLVSSLSLAQQKTLGEFSLAFIGVVFIYAVFWLVTCLWPVMLLWYNGNPLKAYWMSIRQFFRDPLRLTAIALIYGFFTVICSLLTTVDGLFIEIFARLAVMLLSVGLTLTLFVYAWRVIGPPKIDLDAELALVEPPSASAPPLP